MGGLTWSWWLKFLAEGSKKGNGIDGVLKSMSGGILCVFGGMRIDHHQRVKR